MEFVVALKRKQVECGEGGAIKMFRMISAVMINLGSLRKHANS